uniref:Uncharacterized protein n=1 Tax=Romanomermis culicivorax TaxID=13658 RepID=A0A915INS1_ROMCU
MLRMLNIQSSFWKAKKRLLQK